MTDRPRRYRFGRRARLPNERAFRTVFDAQCSRGIGPLVIYTRPNDAGAPRLGLVVGRRVGTAVRRNRIKRLLREAFRLRQHEFPGDYDVIIVVRPHEPRTREQYQTWMLDTINQLHSRWSRRQQEEPRVDRHSPPDS